VNRPRWSLLYLLTAAVFFAVDLIWLAAVADAFYQRHLGHLLADRVDWIAAVLFYAVYIAGIVVFVLAPALRERARVRKVAVMGGLLGLLCYATFDLTNLALIRGWPAIVAVVDIAWGTVLTGTVAAVTYALFRRFEAPRDRRSAPA